MLTFIIRREYVNGKSSQASKLEGTCRETKLRGASETTAARPTEQCRLPSSHGNSVWRPRVQRAHASFTNRDIMASTIVPPLPRSSTNMIEKDHDPLVETLFDHEKWWRDKYHWFSAKGYQLRSRYHPNWRPSFTKSDLRFFHEDGKPMPVSPHLIQHQQFRSLNKNRGRASTMQSETANGLS